MGSKLVQIVVENLEKIYSDDPDLILSENGQYLFENIKTFEDLWHFLDQEQSISIWDPEEVFGFTLCLAFSEPGFDSNAPLSEEYQRAKGNIEVRESRMDPDIYNQHPDFY